ncbi:MAG: hypothetical protein JNM04_04585 [Chthonomonas sp.]|nr:hypothetical protein [Chthonomonas sp.]
MKRLALFSTLAALIASSASATTYLMICDSGNDSVRLVNSNDGTLVNGAFISDSALSTGGCAIESLRDTILISDQGGGVFEYEPYGARLGTIVTPVQISNNRGIAIYGNKLYVTVAGGANAGTIQQFNLDGTGQATFANVSAPAGVTASPWDIEKLGNDYIVTDSATDDIYRFDSAGNFVNKFYTSAWTSGNQQDIHFPYQIKADGANYLVGGFSLGDLGVYQFNSSGVKTDFDYVNTGIRGVHRLGNGLVLWTGGTRYGTLNQATGDTLDLANISGRSFRMVEEFHAGSIVSGTANLGTLAAEATFPKLMTVVLRPVGGGAPVLSKPVWVNSNGSFQFFTTKVGEFELLIGGKHWLKKMATSSVTIAAESTVTGVSVAPTNGDVDGNGVINTDDYLILSENFDTTVPEGTLGDLDDNTLINTDDYLILSDNFDNSDD